MNIKNIKFSPTNWIKLRPIAYLFVTFFALHFMVTGAVETRIVIEWYAVFRDMLGWKATKVWVMQRELLQYLPLLIASVVVTWRVKITLK